MMTAEFDHVVEHERERATDSAREVRFSYLLAALVGLIILYPFLNETPLAYLIVAAINSAILAAAAFAASHSRRTLLLALCWPRRLWRCSGCIPSTEPPSTAT